jgi:hypothetical protein
MPAGRALIEPAGHPMRRKDQQAGGRLVGSSDVLWPLKGERSQAILNNQSGKYTPELDSDICTRICHVNYDSVQSYFLIDYQHRNSSRFTPITTAAGIARSACQFE